MKYSALIGSLPSFVGFAVLLVGLVTCFPYYIVYVG